MNQKEISAMQCRISSMIPGDRICYHKGASFWFFQDETLKNYFNGLRESGLYTFAQKRSGEIEEGQRIFEYWVWRLDGK